MTEASIAYRWTREEFLRAWEAGAFNHRVEFIEGEVWPVVIGDWHGFTTGRIVRKLPEAGFQVTTATLPTGESLPDPDCWVLRDGAKPVDTVGTKVSVWAPADVALIVEVSDETVMQDLGVKANMYGRAGYAVYWVITKEVIYEHTEPTPTGFHTRREFVAGQHIPVRYADTTLAVSELLSTP